MSERYRLRYHPGATDDLFNIFTLIEDYCYTLVYDDFYPHKDGD